LAQSFIRIDTPTKRKKRIERTGAEVLAYRLSGWIAEVAARVGITLKLCKERLSRVSQDPPLAASVLIRELRLGVGSEIDAALPELHYLSAGSGDVAQLQYLARFFDAWLDREYKAVTEPEPEQGPSMFWDLPEFYGYAEKQLTMMRTLHTDATRHIGALVEQAIAKGR